MTQQDTKSQFRERTMEEIRGLSDLILFTSGGCHIFAKALLEVLAIEKYEVRCVRRMGQGFNKSVYHVYAYKNGYMVDALGIHAEEDYIAWATARNEMAMKAEACEMAFLFKVAKKDGQGRDQNELGLRLDTEYLAHVDTKAKAVILDTPERYQLSYLVAGKAMIANTAKYEYERLL